MSIDLTSLDRRSPAALRASVKAQRLGVKRRPDSVEPEDVDGGTYWRYLKKRVPLEGRCIKYQTYDVRGDENDWNINIFPDPAYSWMLDPTMLDTLSRASGAPKPINLDKIKVIQGRLVIECELTPDDGLYDKFTDAGLPISEGSAIPDKEENEWSGPTGSWVGVYGVFAGDYGHDGRPEIHPFDAFWRKFHEPRSSTISWDLGVFQDDSNRFNGDWSRAPIDIEFRVPFCLDVPVTRRTPVARSVRFTLEQSELCSVVGKNLRSNGTPDLSEVFLAPTVALNRKLRNSLEVSVRDLTGLPGRPFALSFADLHYTRVRGPFSQITGNDQAWLSGAIVIRVAVNQDGFAYWNVSGPNSRTAAKAPDSNDIIVEPGEVIKRLAMRQEQERNAPRIKLAEARPVISAEGPSPLTAELVIDQALANEERVSQTLVVRPRQQPIVVDEETGRSHKLESFDLFASASIGRSGDSPRRIEADISGAISRLAGLDPVNRLPATVASIEVDDFVTVNLDARYAPFRDGEVFGEERSVLSESIGRDATGTTDVQFDLRTIGMDGGIRQRRLTHAAPDGGPGLPAVRIDEREIGHSLVIGPLGGAPTALQVDATLTDRFGLSSTTSASVQNFRVFEARAWIERAAKISLAQITRRRDELERSARTTPSDALFKDSSMLGALVDVLESLDRSESVPAAQVAGAVGLAARVGALLSAEHDIGFGGGPKRRP